jgi:hypothetical protein
MLLTSKKEGFTKIGKYTYLAPLLPDSTWGQFTIQKFVDKYNAMENDQLKVSTFTTDKGIVFIQNALEEEALYYVEHGRWPYNSYVTKYLESNPTTITGVKVNDVNVTKENVAKYYPNRYVYMKFIAKKEEAIKPLPESYQIFKGMVYEPEETESPTSLSNTKVN